MKEYKVDRVEVLRYLGYRNQKMSIELEDTITSVIEECSSLATPKYVYDFFDIEKWTPTVCLVGTKLVLEGDDIVVHLKNAEKCGVLATTLGVSVEKALLKYQSGDMTRAVILDAVATTLIEAVTDECEAEIKMKAAALNLYTNFRYSPGYGDFPLEVQKSLVSAIFAEKRIGLTVTETSILIPHKSVTAVIGLFKKP